MSNKLYRINSTLIPAMISLMIFMRKSFACICFTYEKSKEARCFEGLNDVTLRPIYTEKSCPGQEGHHPSRVNFSKRLYEKKVDHFARVKSWLSNGNSARACSDRLALTELTWLGESKCLYGEKLAWLGG